MRVFYPKIAVFSQKVLEHSCVSWYKMVMQVVVAEFWKNMKQTNLLDNSCRLYYHHTIASQSQLYASDWVQRSRLGDFAYISAKTLEGGCV